MSSSSRVTGAMQVSPYERRKFLQGVAGGRVVRDAAGKVWQSNGRYAPGALGSAHKRLVGARLLTLAEEAQWVAWVGDTLELTEAGKAELSTLEAK